MRNRVLIADDSYTVRSVIRTFLTDVEEIEVCGEAVDGLGSGRDVYQIET
jgi:DNA-binding NarL/FixJ family response regulator